MPSESCDLKTVWVTIQQLCSLRVMRVFPALKLLSGAFSVGYLVNHTSRSISQLVHLTLHASPCSHSYLVGDYAVLLG